LPQMPFFLVGEGQRGKCGTDNVSKQDGCGGRTKCPDPKLDIG
jgi:hypothetical protein